MAAVPPQIPGLVGWRPLARGGFATVWEAKQLSLNRLVAVKVDRRTLDSDAEQRRFLREAGAAGRMSGHPGIVTVHDAGILTDDRPYLVMALCEGGSLTKWVRQQPRPSQEEVREVGVRIADALAATHEAQVLHRDVKPANILIDSYGHAGLADFGLAALPDPGMELSETLEAITPAYAPPEVFHRRPPTEAGDVYSLGATLYAVLAGRPPHWPDGGTPNIVDMFERLQDPVDRIPDVDDGLMDLLLEAMAYEAVDRPSAAEFRDRLTALPLGAPVPAARTNGAAVAASGKAGAKGGSKAAATAAATASKGKVAAVERASETKGRSEPLEELDPAIPFPVGEPQSDDQRRPRRRTVLLVAAVAMLLAVSLTVALVNLLPRPVASPPTSSPSGAAGTAGPSTTGGATAAPTAAPSTSAVAGPGTVPDTFEDCSDRLGANVYCTPVPECWGGVGSYADAPRTAVAAGCYEEHNYQTFAAGLLERTPTKLSTLEKLPAVQKTCRAEVVNSMLVNPQDRMNWEIIALGPQNDDEQFFRCIFGRGLRSTPIALKPLG